MLILITTLLAGLLSTNPFVGQTYYLVGSSKAGLNATLSFKDDSLCFFTQWIEPDERRITQTCSYSVYDSYLILDRIDGDYDFKQTAVLAPWEISVAADSARIECHIKERWKKLSRFPPHMGTCRKYKEKWEHIRKCVMAISAERFEYKDVWDTLVGSRNVYLSPRNDTVLIGQKGLIYNKEIPRRNGFYVDEVKGTCVMTYFFSKKKLTFLQWYKKNRKEWGSQIDQNINSLKSFED